MLSNNGENNMNVIQNKSDENNEIITSNNNKEVWNIFIIYKNFYHFYINYKFSLFYMYPNQN